MFKRPVTTSRLRIIVADNDYARVRELAVFGPHPDGSPEIGTGVDIASAARDKPNGPDLTKHHVMVNQIGYNANWPKRFTAPNSPDGSTFFVRSVEGGAPLFEGQIEGNLGDFSALQLATDHASELLVEVEGQGKKRGQSFPFKVQPLLLQRTAQEPALRFMVDCRSVVGTHPSAYGGNSWRDGCYYTYETPSLVLLYLSNPSFFRSLPVEIDYRADRKRVLSPQFGYVKEFGDQDALQTTRRYFRELDPPVGKAVPDLIQMLHWGIGFLMIDPENADPSGDPLGAKVHPQSIEQFAYFLYAYPNYDQYFSKRFYRQAYKFAFDWWPKVGLFDVFKEVGSFKGRQGPGHSIAPNLMMYEVAKRHRRADAERYLDAAVAQAEWYINTLDPGDPRVTRGQRLSEHQPITGFFMLQQLHPQRAPKGLPQWLKEWREHVFARSKNLYDFRKYSDTLWTLPRPWSDPGSVAGFPGIAVAVKSMTKDRQGRERLDELKASHFDTLFGRNPVNAASANKAGEAYPGLDRGWPYHYGNNICARLELCRGTLNTIAAHEHYPFNPQAKFRHPEGWSGFNAAFNVSLAYCNWDDTQIWLSRVDGGELPASSTNGRFVVTVRAPAGVSPKNADSLTVAVLRNKERRAELRLKETDVDSGIFRAETSLRELKLPGKKKVEFCYGHGIFGKSVALP